MYGVYLKKADTANNGQLDEVVTTAFDVKLF